MIASKKPSIIDGPLVSVLVPARNEEDNIGPCIDSLLNQTYQNYEIIVLDDKSDDATLQILEAYKKKTPNLKVIKGKSLPDDWNGKPHAMHQLAAEASGEYFLFVDADTRHEKDSISWAVTNAEKHHFDLLSGYPLHINHTFGEKLVVPNMYLNTALFLPLWGLPFIPLPIISMAIGQFLLFKADSYRESGGYETVKKEITEDVYISREMKRQGYKIGLLDAKKHLRCRMYDDFSGAVDGIGKNIFDFFEKKLAPMIFLIAFFIIFLIAPPFWTVILYRTGSPLFNIVYPGILFFLAGWGLFLRHRKQDLFLPLIYPLMFSMIIIVAVKSIRDFSSGRGYIWKGRILREIKH
ncbi:MAG: glycosyltransferase family 2 protein [Spirochaetales bacterium]|nr:glycosyltransferase family 2 protein [Spirochaetales bacterium]